MKVYNPMSVSYTKNQTDEKFVTIDMDDANQGEPPISIETRLVPAGGTTGQVLTKSSNIDYAIQWSDSINNDSYINLTINTSGSWGAYFKTKDGYTSKSISSGETIEVELGSAVYVVALGTDGRVDSINTSVTSGKYVRISGDAFKLFENEASKAGIVVYIFYFFTDATISLETFGSGGSSPK